MRDAGVNAVITWLKSVFVSASCLGRKNPGTRRVQLSRSEIIKPVEPHIAKRNLVYSGICHIFAKAPEFAARSLTHEENYEMLPGVESESVAFAISTAVTSGSIEVFIPGIPGRAARRINISPMPGGLRVEVI